MQIFKYKLTLQDQQYVDLPSNSKVLTVQNQREDLVLWALCDPLEPIEPRRIFLVGTGQTVPEHGEYIATVQRLNGNLVLHVFLEDERSVVWNRSLKQALANAIAPATA